MGKQALVGWEWIDSHPCAHYTCECLAGSSKVYLNAVMGTGGFPGVYEGGPGFVLNLIQHNWSKDLNTKAWGLKPAQATVSRLSKLTTNDWGDCLF